MAAELDYPKRVYSYFIQKGYTPDAAAAMAANSAHEGPLSSQQLGDNGTAYGRFQWRGDRRTGLYDFATKRGLNPDDDTTQWDYADWELHNTEKDAGNKLFNAQNLGEANDAMMQFLRPAGYTPGNPQGVPSYGSRFNMAATLSNSPEKFIGGPGAGSNGQMYASATPDPESTQSAYVAQNQPAVAPPAGGEAVAGANKPSLSLDGVVRNGLAMMSPPKSAPIAPLAPSPIHRPEQVQSLLAAIFPNRFSSPG